MSIESTYRSDNTFTTDDDQFIIDSIQSGKLVYQISSMLNKPTNSVASRINLLGKSGKLKTVKKI